MDAQMNVMERLIAAIQENTARSSELITLLKKERKPWMSPEEAAEYLMLPMTDSRNYRRRLSRVMDNGTYLSNTRVGASSFLPAQRCH